MFKDTITKWSVQKLTQWTTHLQHHDATDIKKTHIFVFSFFYSLMKKCKF